MMRTLVTGGAGFVGSNLVDRLLAEGKHVLCLDNFQTGREENVSHLWDEPRFELVRGDVRETLPSMDIDEIYHLACPASPPHYQADPIGTIQTCYQGTLHVLELAERTKARVVFSSTSEVYGDPLQHPQSETYWGYVNPIGTRSCYDEGKRIAEPLCVEFNHKRGVSVGLIRIFNTYGPRMDPQDGRVVSNFIVQALRGEALTIYGEGQQTRSLGNVDDLVDGLMRMMGKKDLLGPINIGNPGEFTVAELAEKVLKMTGSRSQITRHPLPSDDPTRRKPDITRAQELLGWAPKTSLDVGLEKTIAYFKEQIR